MPKENSKAAHNGGRFRRACTVTHRTMLAVLGSYAVVVSSAAAIALALDAAGWMPKGAALVWTMLCAYVLYFVAMLWAYVDSKAWRVWLAFGLTTAVSAAVVNLLGGDSTFGFGGGA